MTCSRTGSSAAVRSLLGRGAAVNARESRHGQTALMLAASQEHPEVVKVLLEHGAEHGARSQGGFTPLLFAARQGNLEIARLLLEAGGNPNDATPQEGNALVLAAASGHEEVALLLLEKGADPNAMDENGATALHYAVGKGMTLLSGIEYDALVSYMFRPNMEKLVRALLARKANPNVQLAKAPERLLRLYRPRLRLAGATPFLLAAATGDASIMRLLAEGGADPRLPTKANATPLMVAAGLGHNGMRAAEDERRAVEAVQLALDLDNDVNAVGERGLTALHGAAMTGSDAILRILIEHGARLDTRDRCGQTALSISEGDPRELVHQFDRFRVPKSTAELLRKAGADPAPPAAAVPECQKFPANGSASI
jgi:ankyrin repeat protein